MNSPDDMADALASFIDRKLADQLIEEAVSLEDAFLLKRWKYTELDGGRFVEVASRIVYSKDSGNLSRTKSVDDCLKYIDNDQVPHAFPDRQASIHLAKVLRAIYKLRSQRGAVHVSPTYDANEIDSRLIVEAVRWILADLLRIFVTSNRTAVAQAIQNLSRFPQPLIRMYEGTPLLQAVTFSIEEEILAHLLYCDGGMSTQELVASIPRDPSGVRRNLKKLVGAQCRQIIQVSNVWQITDLGIVRIENRITREGSPRP